MAKFIKQEGDEHLIQRLYVHWDITTMCEYKCSYCYAIKEYGDKWMHLGNWDKQLNVIDELSKSTLPIFLGLLGGEPTYHPKYFEMLDLIHSKIVDNHDDSRLYITTNGAKSLEFYKKHPKYDKTYMLWSWHPEYNDETSSILYIEKIKYMLKLGYKSKINVMLHPKKSYWSLTKKIINELLKIEGLQVHPHFIYSSPHETVKYSSDFYEYFDILSELENKEFIFYTEDKKYEYTDLEVFEHKYNKFKGWKCWNNNYEINLNCEVNQFCVENKKPLQKDYFKNISEVKPLICPHKYCSCDGLLKIHKEII